MDAWPMVSRALNFGSAEPSVVFRIAWYTVASRPSVILEEYSEPEGAVFEGMARFSTRIGGEKAEVGIRVKEADGSVEISAKGEDEVALALYLGEVLESLQDSMAKYEALPADDQSRLRRALVAKACWDRLVHNVLKKAPQGEVYYQVAHGREMIIKATEGEDMKPVTLTTSAWLAKIESLPRDEALPGNVASELAKKSIEWKRETQGFVSRFL
ncbi:MAG: putative selenocysteine system protein [Candidatus Thorarchaeota archaeon]